jgi:hypothetical protein
MQSRIDKSLAVSGRVYSFLLFAYPVDFRREYGPHMAQVFRDCYRAEMRRPRWAHLFRLWVGTLIDLLRTAPKERLENCGKGVRVMKAIRNFAIAIPIYAVVIILTGKFLNGPARQNLPFALGSFIDALVCIGILFNFIVLLLVSTGLMPATRAVVTSAIATVVLLAGVLSLIAMRVPSEARPTGLTILLMVVSFLIWFAIHWLWAQKRTLTQSAT